MFGLLRADFYRSFRRVSVLLVCLVALFLSSTNFFMVYSPDRYEGEQSIRIYGEKLRSNLVTQEEYDEYRVELWQNAYAGSLATVQGLAFLLIALFLAPATITNDFAKRRFGEHLITGKKRWQVVLARYITTFVISSVLFIFCVLLNFLLGSQIWYGYFTASDIVFLLRPLPYVLLEIAAATSLYVGLTFLVNLFVRHPAVSVIAALLLKLALVATSIDGFMLDSVGGANGKTLLYLNALPTSTHVQNFVFTCSVMIIAGLLEAVLAFYCVRRLK